MKKLFANGRWQKILALFFIFLQIVLVAVFAYLIAVDGLYHGAYVPLLGTYLALQIFFEFYAFYTTTEPEYKIAWMFAIGALPIVGILFFVLFANKRISPRKKRASIRLMKRLSLEPTSVDTKKRVLAKDPNAAAIARYIEESSGNGCFENTSVDYYPFGQDAYPMMLEDLKKAKHYIFLEYFIIAEGEMWNGILDILKEKVKEGVDVRVIYDDFGSLTTLPADYTKTLNSYGIKAYNFRPIKPFLSVKLNNRDHRKILVIDGHTGYTGGINIADEYINKKVRFGVWKDNAVRLFGGGVYNLTMAFLSQWKTAFEKNFNIDFYYYSANTFIAEAGGFPLTDGFVQPYNDIPFDYSAVGQNVYLSLIARAERYCYITTPYLILNREMNEALKRAALSGIDIRLITPGIPDKKQVYQLTRSYYGELLEAGVKIYEYTPGFIHAKSFLVDDHLAVDGTINLDYRSLYLHYENAVFFAYSKACLTMKEDFENTFLSSKEITMEDYRKMKRKRGWLWPILRLIAPLL
mgnify:FL=1